MTGPRVLCDGATSVEIVKQRQNILTSSHGEKRSCDQIHANSPHGAIFRDITNVTNAQGAAKRPRVQTSPKNFIEANRICIVGESGNWPSQRRESEQSVAPAPGPCQNPQLSLQHPRYGLPRQFVKISKL